jgi:sugar phosphate isomerase/epimerase
MSSFTRRSFLKTATATTFVGTLLQTAASAADGENRKFTMDLRAGSIGVRGKMREVIALAGKFGFESVAPSEGELAQMSQSELHQTLGLLKENKLVWGGAGMPVDFRGKDDKFNDGLAKLPDSAKALNRAGVTRASTWLAPSSKSLPYVANFRRHALRLREIAKIYADQDIRFGLEYVGPKTSWTRDRFPFVHTMAGAQELIAEIGCPNVGLVLDSWHWYTAEETEKDLLSISGHDVVACDLNDAPLGLEVHEQMDLTRDLPCATGVIDLKTFLNALVKIGYDGPVRAEPFKKELGKLPAEEAVSQTADAMKKAFALVG